MPEKDENVVRKICLLGDPAVGKTSLVKRFVYDQFDDTYLQTIGTKVTKRIIPLEDDNIQLTMMIWDIFGQKSRTFSSIYYKGAKGALLVCDITRGETLEHVQKWADGILERAPEIPFVFLVNKYDLKDDAQMTEEDIKKVASNLDAEFMYTSAKTGDNVEKAFKTLGKKMVSKS